MSLDPSLCAVVLLMSAVSSRGLQTRLRSRFTVSDVFFDSSSPSETTCLYIICHSACLSICLSVAGPDQRHILFHLNRSPDPSSIEALETVSLWVRECVIVCLYSEGVSLCASVIVCLYSEGVSLCASTVRVCHCVPLQWGCVIVCLYSESVSLCASTVRVWHCVPLQWGYVIQRECVIVCLYSEVIVCLTVSGHCVPLQWGCDNSAVDWAQSLWSVWGRKIKILHNEVSLELNSSALSHCYRCTVLHI